MNRELRNHIIESLKKGIRFDGRKLDEYREISVECGVTKNAEGSARVKIGDTELIVGVKMAIEVPFPDTPDQGNFMVNTELLPLSSPDFESGPPGIEAIELSRIVDRGIRESKAIDVKKLCITEKEKVWSIIVDICSINDAGNLFDAASLATLAALKDSRFPKYDGETIDYKELTEEKLPLLKEPIEVTVLKIDDKFLVDPSSEEEVVADSRLTVASTEDGKIYALQKGGDYALTFDEIYKMIDIALDKAKLLRSKL
jgi:exosome complex component RRP42